MSNLKKHVVESHDHLEFQNLATPLFRPIELNHLHNSKVFDLKVELASGQNMTCWRALSASGYSIRYGGSRPHHFELHIVEAGTYTFHCGTEAIEATARSAVLLKDTRQVEMISSPGSRKLGISIPYDRLGAFLGGNPRVDSPRLTSFRPHVGEGTHGMEAILQIGLLLTSGIAYASPFVTATDGAQLLQDALIMTFASFWPRTENPADDNVALPRHLERAIDWLDQHAGEEFSIEHLARQSGASIRTLQNSFRQYLSTNPNAYIQRVRLHRVHQELLGGYENETIEQIASRWGFGHMGYFAARYRAIYGQSPSDTRKERIRFQ